MLVVILSTIPETAGAVVYYTIDDGDHMGLAEDLFECVVHLTLSEAPRKWRVVRHHLYALREQRRYYDLDRTVNLCLINKQAFLVHYKLAAWLPYVAAAVQ